MTGTPSREEFLRELVGMPERVRPVAWLCVGPVSDLPDVPDLERYGWRHRSPLATVLHEERYGAAPAAEGQPPQRVTRDLLRGE